MSSVRLVDSPASNDASGVILRVFVPGNPVSSNHMYGARGYGAARRLTPEARAWRDAVANSVLAWRFADDAPRPLLAVHCAFIGMRADLDNGFKLVIDGVKLGLAVDDRYIMRLCGEKQPLSRRGGSSGSGGERGAWIEVSQLPALQKPAQRQPRQRRQPQQKRTA